MHELDMVYVTNKNDFVHLDRYDGKDYVFNPGEKALIPVFAAELMFGFGLTDKTPALLRHGWAFKIDPKTKVFTEDEEGIKKLRNFIFTRAVMVEANADDPAVVVEPPKPTRRGARLDDAALV